MTKEIRCRDVGVDCDWVASGETEEEIMKKVAEHAKKTHGMDERACPESTCSHSHPEVMKEAVGLIIQGV